MASQLSVLLSCLSQDKAKTVQSFLVNETRPLFEEDVDVANQGLFLAVEELEYPDAIKVEGALVFVQWLDQDRFSFSELLPLLEVAGIELLAAFEVPDEPMASDDDEEDIGCFWVCVESSYHSVGVREAKGLLPKEVVERLVKIV